MGAQVGGQIVASGKDSKGKSIDCGSRLEQGTVMVQIGEALSLADVQQAEAGASSAQAGIQRAEASPEQLKAKLAPCSAAEPG